MIDSFRVLQAFGTTASLEAAFFRDTGKQLLLSEQQLMDCDWTSNEVHSAPLPGSSGDSDLICWRTGAWESTHCSVLSKQQLMDCDWCGNKVLSTPLPGCV